MWFERKDRGRAHHAECAVLDYDDRATNPGDRFADRSTRHTGQRDRAVTVREGGTDAGFAG